MTKTMQKIGRAASALLMVMTLLFPLSARALAAVGTDAIEIGEDGAVTLVSDRLAGERVSSVQVRIGVAAAQGETVSFVFDGGLAGRLTNSSYRDGTLNIYVAGTAPLMAEGQTRLTLGTITGGDPASVTLPEDALEYVYGTRVIAQSAEANVYWSAPDTGEDGGPEGGSGDASGPAPAPESAARSDLQDLLTQADGLGPEGYTQTSYEQLLSAIEAAEAVLADPDAADEDLDAAAAALQRALDQLVPVADADGSGPVIGDGADDGTGAGAPEPTADQQSDEEPAGSPEIAADTASEVTEPTATAAPTPAPSPDGRSSAPHTGDGTPVLFWTLVLCLSGGALAAVALRRGRYRR